ncbi:MAG TPA: type II toxin-antitoxin system prevent-host-death family antitoxin [Burkholderiales bacterium]|nr:type II toxin-antitoxin system prevent-host-death family antitoxin [Burkholderiales bacterium]
METVSATHLKQRLGELLDRASLKKVAIERHGRVVAYLVPAAAAQAKRDRSSVRSARRGLSRRQEERLLDLFTSGDLRPSRWRRAGDPETMAGFAALRASAGAAERARLFALAEQLHPGMATVQGFGQWLSRSGVEPGRLLSLLKARTEEKSLRGR